MLMSMLKRVTEPRIASEGDLKAYVRRVTLFALGVALSVDVLNQMVFFIDWEHCLRSWVLTTGVVSAIALPVTISIGRAHLDLFRQKQEVDRLSRTDPLTSLPNRRAMMEASEAMDRPSLVLVIVDIDRFKGVNDTYGHRIGDVVLQTVATALEMQLGSLGMVGRLGGEEFALLSTEPADAIVERVAVFRERMAGLPVIADNAAVTVTISAGAATKGEELSPMELYSEADAALYAAKAAGRNRLRLSPGLYARCSETTRRLVEEADGGEQGASGSRPG